MFEPVNTINQISTYNQREKYVFKFLNTFIPSGDTKDIEQELRKSFLLHKYKINDEFKQRKKKSSTSENRILLRLNRIEKCNFLCYKDVLVLNKLWLGYLKKLLCIENLNSLPTSPISPHWDVINQKLSKADYHGAMISVIRSKSPNAVKLEGIVLQDTKYTFKIISKDNAIRTVPKTSSVFEIALDNKTHLIVFGKDLCSRPADRCVKKIKNSHLPKL